MRENSHNSQETTYQTCRQHLQTTSRLGNQRNTSALRPPSSSSPRSSFSSGTSQKFYWWQIIQQVKVGCCFLWFKSVSTSAPRDVGAQDLRTVKPVNISWVNQVFLVCSFIVTFPSKLIAKLSGSQIKSWVPLSLLVVPSSVRTASVTSPLISTKWCFRPYKPYIFCEDMILATCQHHILNLTPFTLSFA